MNKDLYLRVLTHIEDAGHKLAEYGKRRGIPHHIWSTWDLFPDELGERLLAQDFSCRLYMRSFKDCLDESHAYDFYPFISEKDDNIAMCMGKEGFLRYNSEAGCFTVSLYPNGYDEVARNSFSWGNLFSDNIPCTHDLTAIRSMVLWFNYCELCNGFTYAMDGIMYHANKSYDVLREFVSKIIRFEMLSYDDLIKADCMAVERRDEIKHISVIGDTLYNVVDRGKIIARFCFDNRKISVEWKDGKTQKSTNVTLRVPELSYRDAMTMSNRCKADESDILRYCMCGFLSLYKIHIDWHCAFSWLYNNHLERLNVKDVDVNSLRDVFR